MSQGTPNFALVPFAVRASELLICTFGTKGNELTTVVCLGWGSFIWDPRELPTQSRRLDDTSITEVSRRLHRNRTFFRRDVDELERAGLQ